MLNTQNMISLFREGNKYGAQLGEPFETAEFIGWGDTPNAAIFDLSQKMMGKDDALQARLDAVWHTHMEAFKAKAEKALQAAQEIKSHCGQDAVKECCGGGCE